MRGRAVSKIRTDFGLAIERRFAGLQAANRAAVSAAAANLRQGDAVMIQGSLDAGHPSSSLDQTRQGSGRRGALLGNLMRRSIARIRSARRTRRGRHELMALDDRMLADIGVSRGDIEYAVRYGRVWGR